MRAMRRVLLAGILIVLSLGTVQAQDTTRFDSRFFDQLRGLFGVFREADLQRAFQTAQAIPCSELVEGDGAWREVAFFNDNRALGDWYRKSLDEVKDDPAVYLFSGNCANARAPVQLVTKYPVGESVDAYNEGRISFRQLAVNTNPAVTATYDPRMQACGFELPFLYLVRREQNGSSTYSLTPQRIADRDKIDPNVTDHWDCKAVRAADVTYQFIICRTTLLNVDAQRGRGGQRSIPFGASAYFILSDGREAASSVRMSFGDDPLPPPDPTPAPPPNRFPQVRIQKLWTTADGRLALVDAGKDEFRLQFNPELWAGKIGVAQVLARGVMSPLESTQPISGADYCVWLPGSPAAVNRLMTAGELTHSIRTVAKTDSTTTSVVFGIKASDGSSAGTLQCYFPRTESVASLVLDRWTAIVGSHIVLQIPY